MLNQKLKSRAVHRAKIIRGQMDGLVRAIEGETPCSELLIQSLAIQKALKSLGTYMLEDHLETHMKRFIGNDDERRLFIRKLIMALDLSPKR